MAEVIGAMREEKGWATGLKYGGLETSEKGAFQQRCGQEVARGKSCGHLGEAWPAAGRVSAKEGLGGQQGGPCSWSAVGRRVASDLRRLERKGMWGSLISHWGLWLFPGEKWEATEVA